jgi:prepilin peptidase CpaA
MQQPFFPNLIFGWVFTVVLLGFTAVASYVDWRRTVVPKTLTISLLALGLVFSLIRVGWLGAVGDKLWVLNGGAVWKGVLDGLLFSLAGFFFAFFLMFVMWVLGTCGGGDVKLVAALGAWLGPRMVFLAFAASIIVLLVLVILKIISGGVSIGAMQKTLKGNKQPKPGKLRLTYSFPVAVATAVVLLWYCRVDLNLASRQPPKGQSHARVSQ